MKQLKVGDRVQLKKSVKHVNCPEGREDNTTAIIQEFMCGQYSGGVVLRHDLRGMRYWNEDDLELVGGAS